MALNFPAAPTNGQVYTLGDRSWIWVSASSVWDAIAPPGEGGAIPVEVFPAVRIGPVGVITSSNGTMATGSLFMQPITIHDPMTLTALSLRCTGFAGAANVRLGLYASQAGHPTTRLVGSADIAVSGTGLVAATISQVVEPGRYWLAVSTDTSGNTYNCVATCDGQMGRSSASASSDPVTGFYRAFTHAALPADEAAQMYTADTTAGAMPLLLVG